MRTLLLTLITCLFALPAHAQYSGGSGTAEDPYRIATAEDLMALGETPDDYDKHFVLTADIDLDPNLPGGKVFKRAVIAPDTDPNDWRSASAINDALCEKPLLVWLGKPLPENQDCPVAARQQHGTARHVAADMARHRVFRFAHRNGLCP